MAFYYLWYGGEPEYTHWNHEILPHWTEQENTRLQDAIGKQFKPPHEIHAPYWPRRGLYASSNTSIMAEQMQELAEAGVGTIVASWWGRPDQPNTHDTQGVNTDALIAPLLDAAQAAGVRVAFHLEPYSGRTAASTASDVAYLAERYGQHPAAMRSTQRALLPPSDGDGDDGGSPLYVPEEEGGKLVCFVYDSYHVAAADWAHHTEAMSDAALLVGLVLEHRHVRQLADAGFHAAYTYFATIGFSYGSTTANWPGLQRQLQQLGLGFIPCVAPGYDDRRIRPWNVRNHRDRAGGGYYKTMWNAALRLTPAVRAVAVTSYNEWGEGTQIEPAVPHKVEASQGIDGDARVALGEAGSRKSQDYQPHAPSFYLGITQAYAARLEEACAGSPAAGEVERAAASDEL